MRTLKTTTIVSAAFLSLLLSACGGGGSSPLDPRPSSSAASSSAATQPSSGAASSIDTTSPADIGRGDGDNFVSGQIAVSHTTEELAAGAATTLSVNIVSSTNTLVTAPIEVTFNSRCYAAGEATLTVGGTATNKTSTAIGQASIIYTAKGCVGADEITASAVIDNTAKVARVTVTVAQDTVQSIRFVDATPDKIFLKDSGGAQTSAVRFLVLGSTGAPIKNIPLNFALSTQVGGIALTAASATTDSTGHASTVVQAGTIPTAVEIIATEPESGVSARSNKLSIGTGMPDQNSMSISASRFNPPGWNHDGEEVDITIRLADAFNNPPPNGTSVQFTTEGGVIAPNCTTLNGVCTVKWESQDTRPSNGRVTILATTVGNESFVDTDGDGLYSPEIDVFTTFNTPGANGNCDPNVPVSTASSNGDDAPCDDLAEAYLDKNENGVRDNTEEFTDFDLDRTHDIENGIYNGVLCSTPGEGCTKDPVNIRQDIVLVMSSDMPYSENGLLIGQPASIEMGANETYSFNVTLADIHGNSMPLGTTISLITNTASDVTINHSMPSGGVANTRSPTAFTVTLKASKTERPSGAFSIAVKSPYLETSFQTSLVPKPLDNTTAKYIGRGLGENFIGGEIEIGTGNPVLAPGGSTSLSVNLVDLEGNLTTGNASVIFSSNCVSEGKATFTDSSGNTTNTIAASTGRATITYNAGTCSGTDEIIATSNLPSLIGNTATTTLAIPEIETSAQNIVFDEAIPSQISIKGTGGTEISQVRFIVRDSNNQPLAGVAVTLSLNNTVGGICLTNNNGCAQQVEVTSDANGYVTALVQAGDIATTVRVTATAENNVGDTVSTQSSGLVVSTGIPDQDSMSLAASEYNIPRYISGYEIDVVVRMADAFNNPVPEGTAVSFTASGGIIDSSCETDENSYCVVKWRNQNPRPANGRVTILATALGNESFIDANGNGKYDKSTDIFAFGSGECVKNAPISSAARDVVACDDLGEAYLDSNQSGIYELIDGFFVDIFDASFNANKDGIRTSGNGKYDGALCPITAAADDCSRNSVTVREDIMIVLSNSTAATFEDRLIGQPGNVSLALGELLPISIILQDANGNSLPAGTTVTITTTNLVNAEAFLEPETIVLGNNLTGPTTFNVLLQADPLVAASGRFQLVVTTPSGATTTHTTTIN
jgi:hypothetical protein